MSTGDAPPLTVEEAQARAVSLVRRVGAERVPMREALGRVLREEVAAPADLPPFDDSAMDGFAVRAVEGTAERAIIGEAAAGHPFGGSVGAGQAVRIMTGAPLPDGADAVVMIERCHADGARVRLLQEVKPGENVRRRGEDLKAGQVVLRSGESLSPAELGVLASARRAHVQVARRPIVAILATGDELRDVDQPLEPGSIPDSSSYTLAALVEEAGATARLQPIVRDDPDELERAMLEAKSADLIVTSGGVSVGEHDHVKGVLDRLGAEWSFWRVNMKPGKPVAVARLGATPFFGLPGNPVSSIVGFLLFVRPAIRAATGASRPFDLPRAAAQLARPLKLRTERRSYLRAACAFDGDGRLRATVLPRQGSHQLSSLLSANGFVVVEPGEHDWPENATVLVQLFRAPR
jgi:molybdopterin molybdotransferase